ncbi:MAG: hypothetical protein V3R98_11720, partial [Alphaproteobacteria bacterium]
MAREDTRGEGGATPTASDDLFNIFPSDDDDVTERAGDTSSSPAAQPEQNLDLPNIHVGSPQGDAEDTEQQIVVGDETEDLSGEQDRRDAREDEGPESQSVRP